MGDAFGEIEDAIEEVVRARRSVKSNTSKQVRSLEEIDQLKSLAQTWFKTHRPSLAAHPSRPDLAPADSLFRQLLEATGRHAARQTYVIALQEAKRCLLEIRSMVATTPGATLTAPVASAETPPSFAPLASGQGMEQILERRWHEVQRCIGSAAYLAATVMMGGMLESLLVARINASRNPGAVFTAKGAPRGKGGKNVSLGDWKLADMIEVAHELGWITKSAKDVGHVLRDFRNYIHPHKEYTDAIMITEDDSRMFWEVTKAIARQVLGSVGKSP